MVCFVPQHIFNDLSGSVSLAWVGVGTGVSVFHTPLMHSLLECDSPDIHIHKSFLMPSFLRQIILALTTFQVPIFMITIGQSKLYRRCVPFYPCWFECDCHWVSFSNVSLCLAARIMGSRLKMWRTRSTTPSSDQISASPSVQRTLGKYVTCSERCGRWFIAVA